LGVAVAAGVFVNTGDGIGVNVAGPDAVAVKMGVAFAGVALSNASTVCAAAVALNP
jgi:hypothetical protein